MNSKLLGVISKKIEDALDLSLPTLETTPVQGGDICDSYLLQDKNKLHRFFVKTHNIEFLPLFSAEQHGLLEIKKSQAIASPKPILIGHDNRTCFLVLTYLPFSNQANETLLGEQLAKMHRFTHSQFGFFEDNFIGTTPQSNSVSKSWSDFWLSQRLQPQLTLAYHKGFSQPLKPLEANLLSATEALLKNHKPAPSLVHGDLWGGNKGFLNDGTPVIFDPACYYGDREVDIAMTRLFGGFGNGFYTAYHQVWPLPEAVEKRRPLYNLYHQLNHLNLFGSGYLNSCFNTIQSLIQ